MVKRAISALLTVILLLSTVFMTSCMYTGIRSPFITRDQLEDTLNERAEENLIVEAGDNINITVEGSGDSLTGAAVSMLSAVIVRCVDSSSQGSGVIYELYKEGGDAFVITNYHVVYNSKAADGISKNIELYLYGMEDEKYKIPATYVGGSMQYDLAVLRVTNSSVLRQSIARAVTFADSDDVAALDRAIAVGNPGGGGISATVGYVNVDSEYISLNITDASQGAAVSLRVMRIDTAVNEGNSGGGLFNERGELIGIVNAKLKNTENIGYAIPSNVVKYVAKNILDYCLDGKYKSPVRCLLGITVKADESYAVYDAETGKVKREEKVIIEKVEAGSAAAGKLTAGDLIVSLTIDGVKYDVGKIYRVVDSMLNARVRSEVCFEVIRRGEKKTVTIIITEDTLTEWK